MIHIPIERSTIMLVPWAVDSSPDTGSLAQYGVLGVFALLMLYTLNKLFSRETKRADDNAAEVARLNAYIRTEALPALVNATTMLKEHAQIDRDMLEELRRITRNP